MSYFDELLEKLTKPEATAFLVGAVVTALASHIWRRFQNRMIELRYTARYTSLARSSGDVFGDKLQVLYRGQEVKGLYVTEVRLRNDSATDLENLVITLEYRNGEHHYGGSGRLIGSSRDLAFSPAFQQCVDRYLALKENAHNSPDLPFIARTREFLVPVLNRGAAVEFSLLTHSEKFPHLHVACQHKGLRVVEEKDVQKLFGVPSGTAGVVGLFASAVLLFLSYPLFPTLGWAAFWSFLIGSAISLVGAGVVWVWRLILKLLGR